MATTPGTPQIDTKLVRELAEILKDASLGEIEVEQGDLRIRVLASAPAAAPQQVYHAAPAPAPVHAQPAAIPAPATSAEPAAPAARAEGTVTSPMVGTIYMSPEPGAKVFIVKGQTVKAGETLMLVEAMKTFNPVTSPRAGTVLDILVTDGQPVEYGEPLVVIA